MEKIEIEFVLDRVSLRNAYKVAASGNKWFLIGPYILLIVGFFWISKVIIDNGLANYQDTIINSMSDLVYPILLIGIFFFVKVYTPHNWLKKVLKNESMRQLQFYTFSADGIVAQTKFAKAEIKWPMYSRIKIGNGIIALFQANKQMSIIPISAFKPEQLTQFKTWAKANVKEVIE
jgi:hypothetical protein